MQGLYRFARLMALAGTLGALPVYLVASGEPTSLARQPTPEAPAAQSASRQAVLDQYCVICHNERNKANAGNVALDRLGVDDVAADAEIWERVTRKLRGRLMPPPGRPRPDETTYRQFLDSLEASLDQAAAQNPNPGRKDTFHRLNRTEYQNVIRDLVALDVDVENLLPVDNPSYGFDNIAGTLTLNESLMEQYLAAAQTIATMALGTDATTVFKEFRAPYTFSQEERLDGFPPWHPRRPPRVVHLPAGRRVHPRGEADVRLDRHRSQHLQRHRRVPRSARDGNHRRRRTRGAHCTQGE